MPECLSPRSAHSSSFEIRFSLPPLSISKPHCSFSSSPQTQLLNVGQFPAQLCVCPSGNLSPNLPKFDSWGLCLCPPLVYALLQENILSKGRIPSSFCANLALLKKILCGDSRSITCCSNACHFEFSFKFSILETKRAREKRQMQMKRTRQIDHAQLDMDTPRCLPCIQWPIFCPHLSFCTVVRVEA